MAKLADLRSTISKEEKDAYEKYKADPEARSKKINEIKTEKDSAVEVVEVLEKGSKRGSSSMETDKG